MTSPKGASPSALSERPAAYLILASASPRRQLLLEQIGIKPNKVIPAEIDETSLPKERPRALASRLAQAKAMHVTQRLSLSEPDLNEIGFAAFKNDCVQAHKVSSGAFSEPYVPICPIYILAADTVVACGHRLLGKPESKEEARDFLKTLSDRRHRVWTAVSVWSLSIHQTDSKAYLVNSNRIRANTACSSDKTESLKSALKLSESKVRFAKLSDSEIEAYLMTDEWRGCAGGYAIQGTAAKFVQSFSGSYTGVVGLPLHETYTCLKGLGFFRSGDILPSQQVPNFLEDTR